MENGVHKQTLCRDSQDRSDKYDLLKSQLPGPTDILLAALED